MKIGIIETGLVRAELATRFPDYPRMFERLLRSADPDLEFAAYSVVSGDPLPAIDDCDGWLITGSRHGVYDGLDWFEGLKAFIRDLVAARRPLIGVCFGHQIVAEALGGEAVESERGWGVGVHGYQVDRAEEWMGDAPAQVDMYAFHQDQVVRPPPGARVFLSSAFCPYAGLGYGESAISVQGHPEFDEDYEVELVKRYAPTDAAEPALAAIGAGAKADTETLAQWFVRFFRQAAD